MAQDTDRMKRGRKRKFDDVVSVRLPVALHNALCREALHRGNDLSDVIREALGNFVSRNTSPSSYPAQ